MDLISIIVPVYNVEKYLERCLDSIVNQSYTNLEIILVNDGSNDDGGSICEAYSDKDKRIITIHKENAGVALARMDGFYISSGSLIMFIDGDDYVECNMVEKMYSDMRLYNVDMVSCQNYDNYGNMQERAVIRPNVGYYDKNRIADLLKSKFLYDPNVKMAGIAGYLCTRLIKREYISECLEVGIGMIHSEDQVGVLSLLYNINSMYVSDDYLYHYVRREGQVTQSYNPGLWSNFTLYFEKLMLLDINKYLTDQFGIRALIMLKMLIKMELENKDDTYNKRISNVIKQCNHIMFSLIKDVNIDLLTAKETLQYWLLRYKLLKGYAFLFYINDFRKQAIK